MVYIHTQDYKIMDEKSITIMDLEKSDLFYLNPIIAWAITQSRNIDGKYFLQSDPITASPWDSPIGIEFDEKVVHIIPAVNSYIIKEYDTSEEHYYVDGCVSNFGEGFDGLCDFYNKRSKELIELKKKKEK
jgi:hypothetical protein